jgi:subfamily B ATP-binding cassette protein MsbA
VKLETKLKPEDIKKYLRVLSYCRPYIWRLVPAFTLIWLTNIFEVAPPYMSKFLVDDVLIERNFALMWLLGAGVMVIAVVKAVFGYVQGYLMTWVGQKVIIDIRLRMYDKVQKLSLKVLYKKRVGEFLSRVTNDVSILQGILANVIVEFVGKIVQFIGTLCFMFYIDWKLTLASIVVVPVVALVVDRAGAKLRAVGTLVQEKMAQMSAVAYESMYSIRIVRAFATERREYERFEEQSRLQFKALIRGVQTGGILGGFIEVMMYSAMVLMLLIGSHDVVRGRITAGELTAFAVYLGMLQRPIRTIGSLIVSLQQGLAAADRVFEILDEPDEVPQAENPVTIKDMRGEVTFDDVWFAYEEERWVLRDLNIRVSPGEKVAIVGATGAGKSTIVDMLLRFYDPVRGRILIDGVDLTQLDMTAYRRRVGFVPQDPVLMKGTLAYNISYGYDGCSVEAMISAAVTAGIHDFITSLPDGYESEVGERGVTLSGGQRQRVAIARAIVRNPAIILMDEATSSLDSMVESQIQTAMNEAMKGRTSIVIAHRLSTIRDADRIIVISDGKVVEEGRHEKLLARRGYYYNLHSLQAGPGNA